MSFMTKSGALMLATTALLAPAGVTFAQGLEGAEARATVSLNVRSGPGTGNGVVDTLTPGERVSVEECRNNWCYIEHSGPDGWVASRYLNAAGDGSGGGNQDNDAGSSFTGSARATVALNVRSGPGTGNRIIDALYEGQEVDVGECRSGWCQISTAGGTGWVSNRYLERTDDNSSGGGGQPSAGGGLAGGFAQSTAALNVRSGAGTGFRVVDALFTGERVEVQECRSNGWCRISSDDGSGWVASRYLRPASGGGSNQGEGAEVSISAPGFSFSIGTGGNIEWNISDGNRDGEVCFFEDFDYGGNSFCAQPGDRDADLQDFNDTISSIRSSGSVEVQVCEDYDFQGRCAVISSNQPRLEGRNNDIISSYRVR
ncbi:MAG TPA: SH3 domain-containing protein [Devosia sp.]|nr:SH3 domain-containing protein [Devosia sp.]